MVHICGDHGIAVYMVATLIANTPARTEAVKMKQYYEHIKQMIYSCRSLGGMKHIDALIDAHHEHRKLTYRERSILKGMVTRRLK